ncbi:hypothetical protein ASG87_02775 [Frateuria sp. Soil773]|uniref:DUF4123 domain-containing protein n=1 Tax=Frateuria sp. Soil773 TaxID=1736407 RepID=UPI0006F2D8BF|nr:DUF4123 domain-containing protein [Frateuria sp. Soil773]KRE89285.1 hypothetical protein ASG87_02775 [Frateuria sp. Soil773]
MAFSLENTASLLSGHLQEDERLRAYILIDPILREPLDASLLEAERCEVTPVPLNHPGLDEGQRPCLVHWRPQAVHVLADSLRVAHDEQADAELEASEGFALGGWLLSSEDAAVVASHLARVMRLPRPGHRRRYFRWADRRVMEWMWGGLSGEQRARLLGPIEQWWSLDRRGTLVCHAAGQITEQPAQALTLGQAQWERADQGELVQALVRGWMSFEPELPEDYLQRAGDAVFQALRLGLSDAKDVVLLGAYTLQIHPWLCAHPKVAGLVATAARERADLSGLLDTVTDPEWDAIRSELQATGLRNAGGLDAAVS